MYFTALNIPPAQFVLAHVLYLSGQKDWFASSLMQVCNGQEAKSSVQRYSSRTQMCAYACAKVCVHAQTCVHMHKGVRCMRKRVPCAVHVQRCAKGVRACANVCGACAKMCVHAQMCAHMHKCVRCMHKGVLVCVHKCVRVCANVHMRKMFSESPRTITS